ncbi:hypothetical protein GCM10009801_46670 [Streptomyces albiaxialis]|uniref:Recombinase family protein n=1 Tax=Streptomyces albiaxialis TaxID=329523 RepID=A0ABP5HRI8_9ACTN
MAVHAGVYARQSSARGNKSEISTVTQREAGTEEAEKRNADSITQYEDLGISAFTGDERPDFDRLLKDCREGRINLIIVYYISRLSRMDTLDAIPIVTELLNLGVTIVSVTEGEFRRGNLMDLIHLIMRLDQAFGESKNKSNAVSNAKNKARALGGYVGGKPPYGFRFKELTVTGDDGKPIVIQLLEPDDFEFGVIADIWRTIKRHKDTPYIPGPSRKHPGSLTGICKTMNATGVPTRGQTTGKETKDSAWDPKTVMRVLRDPRIAGFSATPIYKRDEGGRLTSQIEGYRIDRDPETMEPIEKYKAAIPPAEWYELQEWLDGRGQGKGLSRGQALLSAMDKLHCDCGAVMTSSRTENPHKASYRCRRRKILPGQHEGECTISQKGLDEFVARRIFAVIATAEDDPDTADILAEAARRYAVQNERPELLGERRSLLAERADAKQTLEFLYDREEAGDYDDPVGRRRFLKRKARLVESMESLEGRIAALEESATPRLPIHLWLAPDAPEVDPIGEGSWWESASVAERRELVDIFIDDVVVRKSPEKGRGSPAETRATIEFARPGEDEE